MLFGRGRVAEPEPDFAESPEGGGIVASYLQRAAQASGRRLQLAVRLLQRAEVVGPQEALRIELLGVAVAGGGGLQQIIGVVELAHVSEGVGQARALSAPRDLAVDRRALLLELLASGVLDRAQVRVLDRQEVRRWFCRPTSEEEHDRQEQDAETRHHHQTPLLGSPRPVPCRRVV